MSGDAPHIRPAGLADVPWIVETIGAAASEGFLRHTTVERVAKHFDDPSHFAYLAVVAGRRTGFAAIAEIAPRIWELKLIVVSERRHGYARAIVRHIVAHVFDEFRAHRLYLEAASSNEPARALYEGEGFKLEGRFRDGYPREDGTFEDLIPYGMLAGDWPA